jgi:hypothetical protein
MKKMTALAMIIAGIALAGCSSGGTKASALDAQWTGPGRSVAYKRFTAPMKWAPGQYVVMGNMYNGKRMSINRYTVVRKEAGGWVFESIDTNDKGVKTGMQMLIKGYEHAISTHDSSRIDIIWVKMLQENGTVQMMEGEALMIYRMTLKSTWERIILANNSYSKAGTVTVPAGTFVGTTTITATTKILFKSLTQVSYLHPDVPIHGMVKATDEKDNVYAELLDYGFNGKPVIQ